MAQAPVQKPKLYKTQLPWVQQRASVGDGSNTFTAQTFVKVASGVLALVADSGAAIFGLTIDASHASTDEPYTAPFSENHNVIDPRNQLFLLNLMETSKAVGTGSVTAGSLVIGGQFGIATFGTAGYTTVQGLNYSDTTNKVFQIEEFFSDDVAADLNGRLVVSVLPAAIQ